MDAIAPPKPQVLFEGEPFIPYMPEEKFDARLKPVKLSEPQQVPSVAIYHPDAPQLFESFAAYQEWYKHPLDPQSTIGLLLMRPQVVSKTTKHYDALIRSSPSPP